MNSREKILGAISSNKPVFIESPVVEIDRIQIEPATALEQFTQTLVSIGGTVVQVSDLHLIGDEIKKARDNGKYVVNTLPFLGEVNEEINVSLDATALESVHQSYIGATTMHDEETEIKNIFQRVKELKDIIESQQYYGEKK